MYLEILKKKRRQIKTATLLLFMQAKIRSVQQRLNDHLITKIEQTFARRGYCTVDFLFPPSRTRRRGVWFSVTAVLIGVYMENISGFDWCIHGKYQRVWLVYTWKISAVLIDVYMENISGFDWCINGKYQWFLRKNSHICYWQGWL